MDYALSDSSGTDDDLPPPHRNRFQRGGRAASSIRPMMPGAAPLPVLHGDMETQIHLIEQEAYCSVIRAFKAQSDAISWEKEGLITELRKELRVSDEEHRELLSRVNADETIRRIREWRKTNGPQPQPVVFSSSQPIREGLPSPAVSASRKKQKTSKPVASLSMGAPPAHHPPTQQSSGALRRGPPPIARSKKPKTSVQHPSPSPGLAGRPHGGNPSSLGGFASNEPAGAATYDPLAGKKVWTRWPDDNNFYEAVITDYNPAEGRHALVYDINTANETWEWVNLKEIPSDDIRWENEDLGASRRGNRPGPARGIKKSMLHGSSAAGPGRGRGTNKSHSKDVPSSQNGVGKKALGDIQILHTDTLVKEVERVIGSSPPDPAEIEKAKKALKEHEQALVDAIAKLEEASDEESDGR